MFLDFVTKDTEPEEMTVNYSERTKNLKNSDFRPCNFLICYQFHILVSVISRNRTEITTLLPNKTTGNDSKLSLRSPLFHNSPTQL